jgi:hypothetical protein
MDSYHGVHATFEATGRFGSAGSGSQCASVSVRVERLPVARPGPAAASQAALDSAADAPISSAINCDGTRGPAWIQVPPGP